jgi:hypothetical protein
MKLGLKSASVMGAVSTTIVRDPTKHLLRSALFWVITQRVVVIRTDVSGQPIGSILKGQESKHLLLLEAVDACPN